MLKGVICVVILPEILGENTCKLLIDNLFNFTLSKFDKLAISSNILFTTLVYCYVYVKTAKRNYEI